VPAAASSPLPQARQPSHHIDPPSIPSREPSLTRGRALTTSSRTLTPRSQTPVVFVGSNKSSPDRGLGLERHPSLSYAHNRNTSIVHGGIRHSRNTSFVNSPATSPLSPQVIAASNTIPLNGPIMSQDSITEAFTANGGQPTGSTAIAYAGAGTSAITNNGTMSQTSTSKPERVKSERSMRRGGHHHHRSQSRHHPQAHEMKTVGEYALHHLFNSVSEVKGLARTPLMAPVSLSSAQIRRSASA
jgi:hypothetical protein